MKKKIKKIRRFAFDFDGVIGHFDVIHREDFEPVPNKEVVRAIKILKKQGHKIIIHSTRKDGFLKKYLKKNKIPFDYINENPTLKKGVGKKKPLASVYIDDRAYRYEGQKAEKMAKELVSFRPYWHKK